MRHDTVKKSDAAISVLNGATDSVCSAIDGLIERAEKAEHELAVATALIDSMESRLADYESERAELLGRIDDMRGEQREAGRRS